MTLISTRGYSIKRLNGLSLISELVDERAACDPISSSVTIGTRHWYVLEAGLVLSSYWLKFSTVLNGLELFK